jgi:hypothetical protein
VNLALSSVRDIVKTLAYQISKSEKVRGALQIQKDRNNVQPDERIGIALLFEKLIDEPLRIAGEVVYIVLDGLDEIDWTTADDVEDESQLRILIQCLVKLPTCRLLLISRPTELLQGVRNLVTKTINKEDNRSDIELYIKQVVESSDRLKLHFRQWLRTTRSNFC